MKQIWAIVCLTFADQGPKYFHSMGEGQHYYLFREGIFWLGFLGK